MKKIITTMTAFIIAMGLLAGCTNVTQEQNTSQEENTSQEGVLSKPEERTTGKTAYDQLVEKALTLEDEYGVMSVGAKAFNAKEGILDLTFPEEITAHDQGIFFSDIYDYDGDEIPELLIFRRQEGTVELEYSSGNVDELDRSEYIFEMYEYSETGDCLLSSQFLVGVTDHFNAFISSTSMSVFRNEMGEKTDIFLETTISGQDHPEDISLLRFRYENDEFCDYDAIRYGALFVGENCVLYMEPKTTEAFGILSKSGSVNEKYWDIKKSADTYDDSFKETLRNGLDEFGLTLNTTRHDMERAFFKEHSVDEDPDAAEALFEHSALDCYGTENGTLTPLAFTYLYRGYGYRVEGFTYLKLGRFIYTDDPQGTERPIFDTIDDTGTEDSVERDEVTLPEDLPEDFVFSSGGGAWGTHLYLKNDGSFTGFFYDSNPEPDVSEYCYFKGSFSEIYKKNKYSYSMKLEDISIDQEHEPVEREGSVWVLSDSIYGFEDDGSEYILYTPEAPVAELDKKFMSWASSIDLSKITDTLNYYGIYDASGSGHYGFFENNDEVRENDEDISQITDISQVVEMNLSATDAAHTLGLDYEYIDDGVHYFYKDSTCDEQQGMLWCYDSQKEQINNWKYTPGDTRTAIYGTVIGMDKDDFVFKMNEQGFSATDYFGDEEGHLYYSTDIDQLVIAGDIENDVVTYIAIFSAVDY